MIDFPNSPSVGQIFNSGTGPIYVWDGVAWSLTTTPFVPTWEPIGVYDFTSLGTSGQLIQNLSAFRDLRFEVDYDGAGGIGMAMQFSADNGSTFLTTANYVRAEMAYVQLPSNAISGGAVGDTSLILSTVNPGSGTPAVARVSIKRFNKAFNKTADGSWHANNGTQGNAHCSLGWVITSAVAYNAIKFFASSGTLAGRLFIEGLRG